MATKGWQPVPLLGIGIGPPYDADYRGSTLLIRLDVYRLR